MEERIYVYFCPHGIERKLGCLFIYEEKGQHTYSFQFDDGFLSSEYRSVFIDYDLSAVRGRQFLAPGKELFGFLLDSAPDRWGRALISREERIAAEKEARRPHKLFAEDYLLRVHDESRMGCLRFKSAPDGPFLAASDGKEIPPYESLKDLEYASMMYEKDERTLDDEWLRLLVAPGSSLGGARPKATVRDDKGNLWVAKFPSKHDEYDVGAWEMVANELAHLCGINVPETRLLRLSKHGSTFLSKRFDRASGHRIPFISAMTALGKTDGSSGREDVSYLDIGTFLLAYGEHPSEQLKELWKRIVFNIAISNGDDHLRNHGFLLSEEGWVLSPAYDLSPSIDATHLLLNVDQDRNEMDFEVAVGVARLYGLSEDEAREIVKTTKSCIRDNLSRLAKKHGLSESEIAYMAPAFSR